MIKNIKKSTFYTLIAVILGCSLSFVSLTVYNKNTSSEKPSIVSQKNTSTQENFTQNIASKEWQDILEKARGQTVYFHAWGSSTSINDYIEWAGKKVFEQYGITVKHVKITDTATSIRRILAEKDSKTYSKGSVDLIWVNGENFKTLKNNNLLGDSFVDTLPNAQYLDYENKPLKTDFSIPTEGKEAPWGAAQLTFYYNKDTTKKAPTSALELLEWARKNPGAFTYPYPPNFHGTTFLKQILLERNPDSMKIFSQDASTLNHAKYTQKVWRYLDALHPYLWRKGQTFPASTAEITRLFDEGVLDIGFTFNPYEPENLVKKGDLPPSTRAYTFKKGTIGNIHFLAIPFNSSSKEASKVFINFLLSPQAQAHKATPEIWGDPTVLNMEKVGIKNTDFTTITYSVVSPKSLPKTLAEPHPSWVKILENEWQKRYKYATKTKK